MFMFSDRIGNLIAVIKQAQLKRYDSIHYKSCNSILPVLKKLQQLGYIYGFSFHRKEKIRQTVTIYLKYNLSGYGNIGDIRRWSKPGYRKYVSFTELQRLVKQHGYSIEYLLSTTRGVLSAREALQFGIGGELLCCIYC